MRNIGVLLNDQLWCSAVHVLSFLGPLIPKPIQFMMTSVCGGSMTNDIKHNKR